MFLAHLRPGHTSAQRATGFWQAAEGGQSVDLNAGEFATVAQTFTTVRAGPTR
ncbi:hypothetical protein [Streptomyces pharetrae]|uniref:hypothetical protein n=1 Tax=Streptomyces pharetrae TaxID=291370 RepID=UPI003D9E9795